MFAHPGCQEPICTSLRCRTPPSRALDQWLPSHPQGRWPPGPGQYCLKGIVEQCFHFNPILTGLFESKVLLGGGGGLAGQIPFQILAPKADHREILHGCQDTCKEYCHDLFLAEICLFIMLLWFMQIRCIIIPYLLIFRTNKISEGQFLAESIVEAL